VLPEIHFGREYVKVESGDIENQQLFQKLKGKGLEEKKGTLPKDVGGEGLVCF
jgi:hypothetical protein